MDLLKEWEKLQKEKFSNTNINKEAIMEAITQESMLTVAVLKKRLGFKINWVIFFLILFSAAFLYALFSPKLLVLALLGAIISYYLIGLIVLRQQFNKMNPQIDPSQTTLTSMQSNLQIMKKALRYESLSGAFAMPAAVICGLLLPGAYLGKSITEILSDSQMILFLILGMVILVPTMYLLASKMNNFAYGKQMEALEENIRKMKEL